MAEKAWWQKCGTADHVASAVRKEGEMNLNAYLISHFVWISTAVHELALCTFGMALPSLVKSPDTAEMCSHSEVSSEHWLSNVGSKGELLMVQSILVISSDPGKHFQKSRIFKSSNHDGKYFQIC